MHKVTLKETFPLSCQIFHYLCYVILFEHIKQEQERTLKLTEAGKNVNYFSHHLMQFLRTYVDVSSILPTSI